jgi:D-beta-D-heptose 7-phosphate kinase/D-beta-D-heptose 1-phosphate adenosyltransferase
MIGLKERRKLEGILGRFSRVKILVLGDIMLDRFIRGKVSRISPEAPVPVVVVDNDKETFHLGGAANVVNNIRSLGGEVSLCGLVGDDEWGQKIIKLFKEMGIGTRGVFREKGRQTTIKTRIFANQQQVVRIDRETTDHPKIYTLQNVLKYFTENIENYAGIVISDYGKGLLTEKLIRTIIRRAKESKKWVMVDPKMENFFFYKGATVITPNTKEASEASGIPILDESSLKKVGRKLLKKLGCEALVITRGEEGMAIFEPHRDLSFVPTKAKEVYDVTGAGDTVIGTMAIALGAGADIKTAAELANYAAGIVVGKVGTATVSQEDLIEAIKYG